MAAMALQVVTFEGLVPGRYYHCIVKEGAELPHGRLTYGGHQGICGKIHEQLANDICPTIIFGYEDW
jgi:hypothetical protein